MSGSDRQYLLDRAAAEQKAAERARHPNAAKAHSTLAGRYLDRAHSVQFAAAAQESSSDD